MRKFIPLEEKAQEWGVSGRRVRQLCRQKRIPEAYRGDDRNGSWWIPADAQKPEALKPGRKPVVNQDQ
jgi:hypothetical protein